MIKREDKFRVNVIACHENTLNIVLKTAAIVAATVPSYAVTRGLQFKGLQ